MRKIILFISLCTLTNITFGTVFSDTTKTIQHNKNKAVRASIAKKMVYGGYEIIQPTNLRLGYTLHNNYMAGPTLEFGYMSLNFAQGYCTYNDSDGTKIINTTRYGASFQLPLPLLKLKKINLVPTFGIGIFGQSGANEALAKGNIGGSGFSLSVNGSLSALLGPIKLGVKLYAGAGYAPSHSVMKAIGIIPAISIGFSPQEFLMQPKLFSHRGMAQWTANFKSKTTTTVNKETINLGSGVSYDEITTKTETKSTWDVVTGEQSSSIKDVQPYFFIAPRACTNLFNYEKGYLVPNYGASIGFMVGALYIAGTYDRGNIAFKEPSKDTYFTKKVYHNTRLNGYLANSSRYGGELGLDLIHYFTFKNYITKTSQMDKATSYYTLLVKGGYFIQNNGSVHFNNDSGLVVLNKYITKYNTGKEYNVLNAGNNQKCILVGGALGIGSFVANYSYYWFTKSKVLSHGEFSLQYNIPIIRAINAMRMYGKSKRYDRSQRKV
ncbi:MAG: hypothetical protein H7331_05405 [Bacteroidia bacterium]|nr:hypothetical protein [Bacteroidia bacterium]